MARPSKYETHVAPRFEEIKDWVRNGATDEEVARRLGIAYSTFKEYKNEFSAFSAILKQTKEYIDAQVESALLQSALKGNVAAQIFWVKNRRPKQWRDKPEQEQEDLDRELHVTLSVEDVSGGEE